MTRLLAAAALLASLAACGGTDATGPVPTLKISSPTAGAQVGLGSDQHKTVNVEFTTTGFKAQPCPNSTENCGHLHVLIDGTDCGSPYNNQATTSPAAALFDGCNRPIGSHTITLELHHDDHSAIKNAAGATVSSSVSFTTL